MAKSMHRPWISKTVTDIVGDKENFRGVHNPKIVQVTDYNVQHRVLTFTDREVTAFCLLTKDCIINGSESLLSSYCQIKLERYFLTTVIHAAGLRSLPNICSMKISFPLVFQCSRLTVLGAQNCDLTSDRPRDMNSIPPVRKLLGGLQYGQLLETLSKRQFGKKRLLDSDGRSTHSKPFSDQHPLQREYCLIPPAQQQILDALTSFQHSDVVVFHLARQHDDYSKGAPLVPVRRSVRLLGNDSGAESKAQAKDTTPTITKSRGGHRGTGTQIPTDSEWEQDSPCSIHDSIELLPAVDILNTQQATAPATEVPNSCVEFSQRICEEMDYDLLAQEEPAGPLESSSEPASGSIDEELDSLFNKIFPNMTQHPSQSQPASTPSDPSQPVAAETQLSQTQVEETLLGQTEEPETILSKAAHLRLHSWLDSFLDSQAPQQSQVVPAVLSQTQRPSEEESPVLESPGRVLLSQVTEKKILKEQDKQSHTRVVKGPAADTGSSIRQGGSAVRAASQNRSDRETEVGERQARTRIGAQVYDRDQCMYGTVVAFERGVFKVQFKSSMEGRTFQKAVDSQTLDRLMQETADEELTQPENGRTQEDLLSELGHGREQEEDPGLEEDREVPEQRAMPLAAAERGSRHSPSKSSRRQSPAPEGSSSRAQDRTSRINGVERLPQIPEASGRKRRRSLEEDQQLTDKLIFLETLSPLPLRSTDRRDPVASWAGQGSSRDTEVGRHSGSAGGSGRDMGSGGRGDRDPRKLSPRTSRRKVNEALAFLRDL